MLTITVSSHPPFPHGRPNVSRSVVELSSLSVSALALPSASPSLTGSPLHSPGSKRTRSLGASLSPSLPCSLHQLCSWSCSCPSLRVTYSFAAKKMRPSRSCPRWRNFLPTTRTFAAKSCSSRTPSSEWRAAAHSLFSSLWVKNAICTASFLRVSFVLLSITSCLITNTPKSCCNSSNNSPASTFSFNSLAVCSGLNLGIPTVLPSSLRAAAPLGSSQHPLSPSLASIATSVVAS
jgi:hypothetical protein